ncbi:hypothetical protein UFOVP78_58 [uncultured Caudovirales phage]|uniref:Uncharacterized protein n=1 Tax=uncultured Caudovirales phage TaxID=2100421 RepID=A0A6J5L0N5_9CAUD|nr:hypothetical protein UFOVP78_58 [uncultured Caudovirales phage]
MVFAIPAVVAAAAEAAAAAGTVLAVGEGAAAAGTALAATEAAAAGAGAAATAAEAGTAGSLLAAGGTTATTAASTTASAGGVLGDAAAGLSAAGGTATGVAPSALSGLSGLLPTTQQALAGASLLSGAASANQQALAGERQAAANKYNAKVAENSAIGAVQQGTANEALLHARNTKQLGAVANAQGATGIQTGSGSPLDVMADMAGGMALDQAMARWNGDSRANAYGAQATLDRTAARTARTSGNMGAAGTLLATGVRAWAPTPQRAG